MAQHGSRAHARGRTYLCGKSKKFKENLSTDISTENKNIIKTKYCISKKYKTSIFDYSTIITVNIGADIHNFITTV